MLPAQRRQALVGHLRATEWATTAELAELLDVSSITVRRDLEVLDHQGVVQRQHGGARIRRAEPPQPPSPAGAVGAVPSAIAVAAASRIGDGDAILLGAGPLLAGLARMLTSRRGLTVVTNSITAAEELAGVAERVEVLLTGGSLSPRHQALVGGSAESVLAGMHARSAFVTGTGLTADRGLMEADVRLAAIHAAMARAAADVVVLAPTAILGRRDLSQSVEPVRVAHVITDATENEALDELERLGSTITRAS